MPYRWPLSRCAALGGLTCILLCLALGAAPARAQTPLRVAVMPFKALAGQSHGWIGAGVAETLTSALASVPELRVVERSQLRAVQSELRLSADDLAEDQGAVKIGRLLSAGKLVLGSFQIAAGEILINGRFVDTQTGVVMAGKTFQLRGKVDHLFDLYPKLVERVLATLGVQIQGKTQETVTAAGTASQSLRAEELYVRGREAFHERTLTGYRQAVDLLQQAVDEDPAYALGFAALAEAQAELGAKACARWRWYQRNPGKDAGCHIPSANPYLDELAQRLGFKDDEAARAAAQQGDAELQKSCARWPKLALSSATTAVSLAPALPAAHRALSLAYWHSGQRPQAEIEARTLLNLNRVDPWGFYLLGLCSTDAEESRRHHRRSLQIDPQLSQNHLELAVWDAEQGQEAQALELAQQGLRLSPGFAELKLLAAQLLLRAGQAPAALAQIDGVLPGQSGDGPPLARFLRGVALWTLGGPQRPWDRREAWQDAAALEIYRARLHEPALCTAFGQPHPEELWTVLLPPWLLRGAPWDAWRQALRAMQLHMYDHDNDHKGQTGVCTGKPAGRVYFLDLKDNRRVVSEWVRPMLMKNAAPELIDRWWNEFHGEWTMRFFEVVVCTGQPLTPDEPVQAALFFDGEAAPMPSFFPLGPDGWNSGQGLPRDVPGGLHGAPARFVRPRSEFHVRGRLSYGSQRRALEDGSVHRITIKVHSGGKLVAEGQIPFHLVDTSEFKE